MLSRFDRHVLLLGGLFGYGLLVDPETGRGGLPCLWQLATGSGCFGCGLSRAGALLLRGRVFEAADMNLLIFPVALLVGWELAGVISTYRAAGVERWQN